MPKPKELAKTHHSLLPINVESTLSFVCRQTTNPMRTILMTLTLIATLGTQVGFNSLLQSKSASLMMFHKI
jgi:hypothetical protein